MKYIHNNHEMKRSLRSVRRGHVSMFVRSNGMVTTREKFEDFHTAALDEVLYLALMNTNGFYFQTQKCKHKAGL